MIISVLYGVVVGLGLSIVFVFDYIIVERYIKIVMNFIGIVLISDGGGYFLLEKCIGVYCVK